MIRWKLLGFLSLAMPNFLFKLFIPLSLCFFSLTVKAQLRPPVKNFSAVDYRAENQNWDISQSSTKHIYVANNKGLLEFNGAVWKLYLSPNESIMRSVSVVNDRIYTGCYMEFGFWTKNSLGTLEYTSLSKRIEATLIEDEEFWNIVELSNLIVFQSKKRIYIYNTENDSVNMVDSDSTITKVIKVDDTIYFQRAGEGIFKIEYGKDVLVTNNVVAKTNEIINIFENGNDLLVLTRNQGFFDLKGQLLIKSDIGANPFLSSLSFYDGIKASDGGFVLGTISNGVVYLDNKGELSNKISQTNGLLNNTVLSIFEDLDNNIWLGLDNGLSYVNTSSPYRVFNDNRGVLGSVYAAAKQNGILYLGTNQGLFYKPENSFEEFKLIQGTKGQVWNLKTIDGELFCAHHSGTFIVNATTVKKVANVEGTWDISSIDGKADFLIQGNYDGLYVLEKTVGQWRLKQKIKGFNNSSRYFQVLDTTILVNHEYNGVFNLTVDSTFQEVRNVSKNTSIKGANSGMTRYKGNILYSYDQGVMRYEEIGGRFVRDSLLSGLYTETEYESGKLIYNEDFDILWAFTQSDIAYLTYEPLTNIPKINKIPLNKDVRNGILGYESMLSLGDDRYLTGTNSGYLVTDLKQVEKNVFSVVLDYAAIQGEGDGLEVVEIEDNGEFDSDENNIEFSYYSPNYNKLLATKYQFRLEGMYDSWSTWSTDATISFENIPHGEYVFKVKSKIGGQESLNTASYAFEIAKPWYLSTVMFTVYGLSVGLLILMMHFFYKRSYKKQRLQLVESNKQELEIAKIQSEKEIIRIKNQKLEAEFKGKSKELAASTLSIIKKNELLTQIKDELTPIADKEGLKPVIKIINQNLNQNDDWELFQVAFNNADNRFLKKVKEVHPNLSPSELKLCAYLRLNLSSKEIAQLLNISPRSVEIKRYRLRKKLKLEHEENLVNYIIKL